MRIGERAALQERNAFEEWMQRVVAEMETGYGIHPEDLPDCTYADWHSLGLEPNEAAKEAVTLCREED